MSTRRAFLRSTLAVSATALLPGGLLRASAARAAGRSADPRLVVLLLRGGMDGLGAVPALGDPQRTTARAGLALPDSEILALDGFFGLHPALKPLHAWWDEGALLPIHAAHTPYRQRSHFDGSDLLENGTTRPGARRDGWLARALTNLGAPPEPVAVGQVPPLLLRGGDVSTVTAGSPRTPDADFLDRLASLYASDPLFGPALDDGLDGRTEVASLLGDESRRGPRRGPRAASRVARVVGGLLAQPDGARVAVAELGGWDTHQGQGTTQGRLARQLGGLAEGLVTLREHLGAAWADTVVLVVSEFGRTVAKNGTNGTDHGTAGAAFLAGGAVAGGRVLADWPGLGAGQLHEGRDLRPTTDLRGVFKGVLRDHLGVSPRALASSVFPDSANAPALDDLLRS